MTVKLTKAPTSDHLAWLRENDAYCTARADAALAAYETAAAVESETRTPETTALARRLWTAYQNASNAALNAERLYGEARVLAASLNTVSV